MITVGNGLVFSGLDSNGLAECDRRLAGCFVEAVSFTVEGIVVFVRSHLSRL